jgi:hypothetical protein
MSIDRVHIPIYCDSEESKYGALLTLKTIRVGFPNANITACWSCDENRMDGLASVRREMKEICHNIGAHDSICGATNDKLVADLAKCENNPFAVIDSDVVFYENCEDYEPSGLIAGEFIPEFVCPIAKAVTASRLHTAFFVVNDPEKLRRAIELAYRPVMPKFCPFDPFAPVVTFDNQIPRFHDSCSVLYHAVGGEKFDDGMLKRFEHLYGGSYVTKGPHLDRIRAAYENPETARGVRDMMTRYFEERKP